MGVTARFAVIDAPVFGRLTYPHAARGRIGSADRHELDRRGTVRLRPTYTLPPMPATEPAPDPVAPGLGRIGRLHVHLELLATVLLAIAAVATAWSSYQSSRWSGVQAIDFSRANAARVESTRASDQAGQETQVDVLTFTQWANAYAAHDVRLSNFYFQRFRPEFRPAVLAWVATQPLKNADAPPTPFSMPQYKLVSKAESQKLLAEAEVATDEARRSNQRSDNYVLAVVLFAASLFFAGISTKLTVPRQRVALLLLGYVLFLGTAIWLATFPVTVSV
jgi:hypothetical protein